LTAVYMAVLGVQTVGRAGEILFLVVAINAVITAVLCLLDAGEGLLSSAASQKGVNIIGSGIKCASMFGGAQALFVLLPYTDGENKVKKAVYAVLIAVAVVVLFTYTAVSKFGLADTAARMFPALNIMDTVSLEFIFGDKQDVFMLRLWIFAVFSAVGLGIFSLGEVFGGKRHSIPMLLSGLAALAVSVAVENAENAVYMLYTAGKISLVLFGVILPLASLFFVKGGEAK